MEIDGLTDQGLWQLFMELDDSLAGFEEAPFSFEIADKWAPIADRELDRRFGRRAIERVCTYSVRSRATGEEMTALARDEYPLLQKIMADSTLD